MIYLPSAIYLCIKSNLIRIESNPIPSNLSTSNLCLQPHTTMPLIVGLVIRCCYALIIMTCFFSSWHFLFDIVHWISDKWLLVVYIRTWIPHETRLQMFKDLFSEEQLEAWGRFQLCLVSCDDHQNWGLTIKHIYGNNPGNITEYFM